MSSTNPVSTRSEVYAAIDGERNYADQCMGSSARADVHDNRDLGSMILLIEAYVDKAKEAFAGPHPAGREAALHQIRKAAALAVGCMEYHGALKR
jgi:hypothetical protein